MDGSGQDGCEALTLYSRHTLRQRYYTIHGRESYTRTHAREWGMREFGYAEKEIYSVQKL